MLCATLAMVSFSTSKSFAGTDTTDAKKEVKPLTTEITKSCITGDLGVNVVSAYFSRGILQENQSFIIEPYADLYFKLYEGDGFLNSATLNLGVWDSAHEEHTGAIGTGSSTSAWYESDVTSGISLTFAKIFTFTPSYYAYLSPNDAFATFQGINLNLAVDDSQWLGAFALHPHFTTLFELSNKAGLGSTKGVYYEVGVAPALPTFAGVTVSFPLTVGFGSHGFYAGDAFGYFSAGANASYALSFIPSCLGSWSLNGSATYYYLHDNLATVDVGRHNDFVFSGGFGLTF
ncbi:MAG: hypothetical protein QM796_21615 [Chthoniobacteraceae bacterium]